MNARTKLNSCLSILRIPSYQVHSQQSKRFFSNYTYSNFYRNFPWIKIKGENKFGEFTNRPNYQVFASVLLNGKVHSHPKELPVDPDELVKGKAIYLCRLNIF